MGWLFYLYDFKEEKEDEEKEEKEEEQNRMYWQSHRKIKMIYFSGIILTSMEHWTLASLLLRRDSLEHK